MGRRTPIAQDKATWGDLQLVTIKIRGLGFLLERQKADGCPPLDYEELFEGVGMVVRELGEEASAVATELEERQLK